MQNKLKQLRWAAPPVWISACFSREEIPHGSVIVVGCEADGIQRFWNADSVALASSLFTVEKCHVDVIIQQKGLFFPFFFNKANGPNFPKMSS